MEIKTATAFVYQVPVKVEVTCPHCQNNIEMTYKDFCDALEGCDPPDWTGRSFDCTHCKKPIEILDQDWD